MFCGGRRRSAAPAHVSRHSMSGRGLLGHRSLKVSGIFGQSLWAERLLGNFSQRALIGGHGVHSGGVRMLTSEILLSFSEGSLRKNIKGLRSGERAAWERSVGEHVGRFVLHTLKGGLREDVAGNARPFGRLVCLLEVIVRKGARSRLVEGSGWLRRWSGAAVR